MAIYLDDERLEVAGEDLASVLEAAQARAEADGRIIVEVIWEGRSLVGQELTECQSRSVADTDIRLISQRPASVAREALDLVRQDLERARDEQAAAAELLQQDKFPEAVTHLGEAVKVWLAAQETVSQAAALTGMDLERHSFDGQPVVAFLNAMTDQLRDLRDRLTDRDVLGLADALGYEWPALIDRWQKLLESMAQALDEGRL